MVDVNGNTIHFSRHTMLCEFDPFFQDHKSLWIRYVFPRSQSSVDSH